MLHRIPSGLNNSQQLQRSVNQDQPEPCGSRRSSVSSKDSQESKSSRGKGLGDDTSKTLLDKLPAPLSGYEREILAKMENHMGKFPEFYRNLGNNSKAACEKVLEDLIDARAKQYVLVMDFRIAKHGANAFIPPEERFKFEENRYILKFFNISKDEFKARMLAELQNVAEQWRKDNRKLLDRAPNDDTSVVDQTQTSPVTGECGEDELADSDIDRLSELSDGMILSPTSRMRNTNWPVMPDDDGEDEFYEDWDQLEEKAISPTQDPSIQTDDEGHEIVENQDKGKLIITL